MWRASRRGETSLNQKKKARIAVSATLHASLRETASSGQTTDGAASIFLSPVSEPVDMQPTTPTTICMRLLLVACQAWKL